MPKVLVGFLSVLVSAAAVSAQGIGNLTISGNQVTATVDLPGISADLALTFEQSVGLTASNLGLSAQLVDPHDPSLLPNVAGRLRAAAGTLSFSLSLAPATP